MKVVLKLNDCKVEKEVSDLDFLKIYKTNLWCSSWCVSMPWNVILNLDDKADAWYIVTLT